MYKVKCFLPDDQEYTKSIHGLQLIQGNYGEEKKETPVRINFYDGTNQLLSLSYEHIGEKLGFNYTPRLIFLSRVEFANSSNWESVHLDTDIDNCQFSNLDRTALVEQIRLGKVAEGVSVRYINNEVGLGLFAESDFLEGTCFGEYTGVVGSSKKYEDEMSSYCMTYPSCDGGYSVDAAEYGNIIRFANHSSQSNCQIRTLFLDGLSHLLLVSCTMSI